MPDIVNVYEAKTKLSLLLDRVAAGEEIIIAKAGTPIAKLVPVEGRQPRRPGFAKGEVGDEFFEPLPNEEIEAWER
ncbi:MAG: type II toxin-antitoxin system Phd/YefM family antitoxin [Proteobacteria bacterium]|nr:type II toxin-antitoxin system Phd/YefM family antitoxin [Pseudomonadota bacterium]